MSGSGIEGLENPSNYECARYGIYSIHDLGQRNSNSKPDMPSPGPMQRYQRNHVLQILGHHTEFQSQLPGYDGGHTVAFAGGMALTSLLTGCWPGLTGNGWHLSG